MPVKITDLDASTTITGNDFIQIIDSDNTSMSPTGTNRKITASNAANQLANLISSVPPIVVSSLATKANLNSPTFAGNVVLPDTTSIGAVNSAEIGRLSGVTSSIQTQLDDKAPLANPTFTGTITGSLSGNSTTATTLQNPRTIALSGDITGTATSFNGSANITVPTVIGTGAITPAKLSTGAPSWNTGGTLSATAFSGPLTGAVTGNVTGIASGNIKQGGGTSQLNNTVYVGWSSASKLRVQVDVADFGSTWPIDISGNSASATTASSVSDASISASKLSGAQTGTAPVYGIRAWAKLNPYVGSVRTTMYKTGTYVASNGNAVTVTVNDHGLKANDRIRLVFTRTAGTGTVPSSATYFDVITRISADTFTVSFTSAGSSGTVQAQFVKIQGAGNISSASFYDSGDDRIILNFTTPMPHANYCTQVTSHLYPGSWWGMGAEDTLGETQLNTIYNCHIGENQNARFLNVCVVG